MAVDKDDEGRRFVQVEVEVPGTPEEVWRAIATGEGITSWFVPTKTEHDEHGNPIKMISDFGPGMESLAKVTDWNPPHSFSAESKDLGDEAPVVASQWIVETKGDGNCVVRVVHSLFASTEDWDDQLEGWESGWPSFFRLLRLYLKFFPGEPSTQIQLSCFCPMPRAEAWASLYDALGFSELAVGQEVESIPPCPHLSGVVERVGDVEYPEELLLRMNSPTTGIAHFFAMEMDEQVLLSLRFYLYGNNTEEIATNIKGEWSTWQGQYFPSP